MKTVPRDIEVLDALSAAVWIDKRNGGSGWVTPLACGGYNGSDHSYRLKKLARLGLVDCRKTGWSKRGSNRYRITGAGLVRAAVEKASCK